MESRRKTIVINKKFQYQYSLLAVAVTVLTVNLFIIFRMFYPGEQPLIASTESALILAAVEFVLVAGVWYGCLKASHRIAGPVYVFAREVVKIGGGDFTARIRLRQHDMFTDEADTMNTSFESLRSTIHSLKQIGQQLQESDLQGESSQRLLGELREALAGLTTEDLEK